MFTSPFGGFFYATNSEGTGFQSGNFSTATGPTTVLGNYHFAADQSRAANLLFAGAPASLSVTDAFDNVWTLSLPGDALLAPTTITMTPVTNVDSTGAVLPAEAAVLLSPDGIQFSDGVTLTVTTPGVLSSNATLVNTALDGSNLSFASTTSQGNTYSTTLFHFSSIALSSPSTQQQQNLSTIESTILASYNAAAIAAQSLASRAAPPPPPDELWCNLNTLNSDGAAYLAQVFGRDFTVISQLLSSASALESVGDSKDTANLTSLISQVFQNDIFPRAADMINFYGGDPEALPIISVVCLQLLHQAQTLGVSLSQGSTPLAFNFQNALANNLPADFHSAGLYYLNQLRYNHIYSAANSLLAVIHMMQDMGSNSQTTDLLAALPVNLIFQLTLDITATYDAYFGGYLSDVISLEAKGTYQLTYSFGNIKGSGTCNYLSGQNTEYQSNGHTTVVDIAPNQSFSESSTLVLNDCPTIVSPTALLTFTGFGSATETWLNPPPAGNVIAADLRGISSAVFASEKTDTGFSFLVPLQDGDAEAVNQTIIQTEQSPDGEVENECSLNMVLQHIVTPQ